MEWIPIVVIAVLALIIVISNIHIVQQSRAYVIERLGAFSKVWQVGMHVKVPFIERVAKKVSLKEHMIQGLMHMLIFPVGVVKICLIPNRIWSHRGSISLHRRSVAVIQA